MKSYVDGAVLKTGVCVCLCGSVCRCQTTCCVFPLQKLYKHGWVSRLKGQSGRFSRQHEQPETKKKKNLTHTVCWLTRKLSSRTARFNVTNLQEGRATVQWTLVTVILFFVLFTPLLTVCEWVCVCIHYIFVHMNIVNAVFTCFPGWPISRGGRGEDEMASMLL